MAPLDRELMDMIGLKDLNLEIDKQQQHHGKPKYKVIHHRGRPDERMSPAGYQYPPMYPQATYPLGTYPLEHGQHPSHSQHRSKHARKHPPSPVQVTNNFHVVGGLEHQHGSGSRRHRSTSHSHAYDYPSPLPGIHHERPRRQSLAPELPPLSPRSRHPLPHRHNDYHTSPWSPRHPSHPRHSSRSPLPPQPAIHGSFLHPNDAYSPPRSPYARPCTPPLRPSRQHSRHGPPPLSPRVRHVRPSRIDDDDDDDDDEYGRFGRGGGRDSMEDFLDRRDRGY